MAEIFLSEPWITEARALYESWADRLPPGRPPQARPAAAAAGSGG